ncbi:MAG: DUF3015 domain-containing protein [Chrysiogenetes bacterium]|nr:DUF3015 domain-containing protein [Chrysiogenetes bacterium]
MKKILSIVSMVAMMAFVAAPASAASYGMAGCGLGSMVFGPSGEMGKSIGNSKVSEVLAATTNGTFGSQTFGITTGTSNCTSGGMAMMEKEQELFAEVSYDEISREMAKGEGEYLTAFATVMGCSADVHSDFASVTKANYGKIFGAEASASDVVSSVKSLLRDDASLAKSCSRL